MSDDDRLTKLRIARIVQLEREVTALRRHLDDCPYAGMEWWCMHSPEHVDTDCYEADGNTPAGGAVDLRKVIDEGAMYDADQLEALRGSVSSEGTAEAQP